MTVDQFIAPMPDPGICRPRAFPIALAMSGMQDLHARLLLQRGNRLSY